MYHVCVYTIIMNHEVVRLFDETIGRLEYSMCSFCSIIGERSVPSPDVIVKSQEHSTADCTYGDLQREEETSKNFSCAHKQVEKQVSK